MTTPTHIAVNLGVFLLLMQRNGLNPDYADLSLLVGSNLIDLDHLLTRPVYDPKRNSFKTHLLHRNWKIGLLLSLHALRSAVALSRPRHHAPLFFGLFLQQT